MAHELQIACPKCGSGLTAKDRFCGSCGSAVPAPEAASGARDPLLLRLREVTLGDYDVHSELGRGGMAAVYLAYDLRLQRKVAIKVMLPHLIAAEGMTERFMREARTAASLAHPNIVVIHAVSVQEDLCYIVMNLIEGAPLDYILRSSGPLPLDETRWILSQAARALSYAHQEGVVHRDVKPANIMITARGDAVLTDFGIAKASDSITLTQTGSTVGTLAYMSPEQVTGVGVTGAADQYSLGVVAYEMLGGELPFRGSALEVQWAHVHREPKALRELAPRLPKPLAAAVMRMLSKRASERWPSLDALADTFSDRMPASGGTPRATLATRARERQADRPVGLPSTPQSPIPTLRQLAPEPAPSPPPVAPSLGRPGAESPVVADRPHQLTVGDTVTLSPDAVDAAESVRFSSSDRRILTVDQSGHVLALARGTAHVLVQTDSGEERLAFVVTAAPLTSVTSPVFDIARPAPRSPAAAAASGADAPGPRQTPVAALPPVPPARPVPILDSLPMPKPAASTHDIGGPESGQVPKTRLLPWFPVLGGAILVGSLVIGVKRFGGSNTSRSSVGTVQSDSVELRPTGGSSLATPAFDHIEFTANGAAVQALDLRVKDRVVVAARAVGAGTPDSTLSPQSSRPDVLQVRDGVATALKVGTAELSARIGALLGRATVVVSAQAVERADAVATSAPPSRKTPPIAPAQATASESKKAGPATSGNLAAAPSEIVPIPLAPVAPQKEVPKDSVEKSRSSNVAAAGGAGSSTPTPSASPGAASSGAMSLGDAAVVVRGWLAQQGQNLEAAVDPNGFSRDLSKRLRQLDAKAFAAAGGLALTELASEDPTTFRASVRFPTQNAMGVEGTGTLSMRLTLSNARVTRAVVTRGADFKAR